VVAALALHDGTLTLTLARIERIEGFHRDLTAPLSAVTAVWVVDDPDSVAAQVSGVAGLS